MRVTALEPSCAELQRGATIGANRPAGSPGALNPASWNINASALDYRKRNFAAALPTVSISSCRHITLQGHLKVEQSRDPRGSSPLAGGGERKPPRLPFPTSSLFSRGGAGKKRTF